MTPSRGARVVGALAVGALVVGLGGCSRGLSRGDVRDALAEQTWPAGAAVEVADDTGGGRYARPQARAHSESRDAPWRAVGAQVEAAQAAGWTPVYAQCAGPGDSVRVDLVREVLDGVPAAATVTGEVVDQLGQPAEQGSTAVSVVVVAAAPQDVSDPVLLPGRVREPVPADVATCVTEPAPGAGLRWAGTPAVLPEVGGPRPG